MCRALSFSVCLSVCLYPALQCLRFVGSSEGSLLEKKKKKIGMKRPALVGLSSEEDFLVVLQLKERRLVQSFSVKKKKKDSLKREEE